jgi:predicted DCC family thiol-disulfide oxidoreductase YuxK
MSEQAIVLYDRDCGFCRWSLAVLLRWDRAHRLWPSPIQSPVGDRWLAGMPSTLRLASWHVVTRDGGVTSAGPGLAVAAALLPGGRPVAAVLRALEPAVAAAYRFVATHRRWFSRPLRRSWVRAADARVEARERERPPVWADGTPAPT